MEYLQQTAREFGVLDRIRFNTIACNADWKSSDRRWYITTDSGSRISCRFLFACSGLFDYDEPFRPHFPGQESFNGPIVHPQLWSESDDKFYPGKRVAIIGSGATAVTMLPVVAETAQHVTMIQRTPTYIVSTPETDVATQVLQSVLPSLRLASAQEVLSGLRSM